MMQGLMMDVPLTTTGILRHAERYFGHVEVVAVTAGVPRHRSSYAEVFGRARQLAGALSAAGIRGGDRIGTLAWNDHRHVEIYYGVSGMGAVVHTINPRLFPEQIAWIVNHAGDRMLFVDPLILPVVEKIAGQLDKVERFYVLCNPEHMPVTSLRNARCYEDFLAGGNADFAWPVLDERTACGMCYTSGTTGHPKGVLYDHRSTVLHALLQSSANCFGLSVRDTVMPVVPMFHVNAWGTPYAAPMVGAKLVLPGPKMGDGETLQALIEEEGVNVSAGVPTVWLNLLRYLDQSGKRIEPLKRVVIGGSACPLAIIEQFATKHDVRVHHAWGMTEMSPLGTFNYDTPDLQQMTGAERTARRCKQGAALFGVEMKIVDDEGRELPWDGRSSGLLKVRGPTICRAYFNPGDPGPAHDEPGWFATGDVATIDASGFMQITDRAKDVIKSGGEWISSIDVENAAVGHPQVAEAAVIGVRHPKWDERPLLVVVRKPGAVLERDEMLDFLRDKIAKWWLPDDVQFVDEIPHTATGKISKLELRKRFCDYRLPRE
jgi:fatty-acyl-CoA synthase